jgi:predicted nucleic acid-binding Zn ribbon protein
MKKDNETTLKEALHAMVDQYRLKSKLNQTRIRSHWEDLMGPSIVHYTREIKMGRKKLYIYLDSAPLRQELSMGREKIRKMLNERLGEEYIKEVVIL